MLKYRFVIFGIRYHLLTLQVLSINNVFCIVEIMKYLFAAGKLRKIVPPTLSS